MSFIDKLIKKADDKINSLLPAPFKTENIVPTMPLPEVQEKFNDIFPDWYISLSFGYSTSNNYQKAIALAKASPQYHEQHNNGHILHQAIYSAKSREYLAFIMLYELVGNWKSSFVMINGELVDRKIVGKLNYCYGDRCRSGNPRFCYGASYMTENPFGCHRLQISAWNGPWWSYYKLEGNKWILDTYSMKMQIESHANIYGICPCFDYNIIIQRFNQLPRVLTIRQMEEIKRKELCFF